jgi:hypothetical protein
MAEAPILDLEPIALEDYRSRQAADRQTAVAIERLDPGGLRSQSACVGFRCAGCSPQQNAAA